MNFKRWQGWVLGLSAVAVFLGTVAVQGQLLGTQKEAVAFVTIGLDQSKLSTEVSSYEIDRATEHFSDIVLGWTVEPSFLQEFDRVTGGGFAFTGRRQEKSNLLFTVTGAVEDTVPAQELVDVLRERLAEFDSVTHAGYVVGLERESVVEVDHYSYRVALGVTFVVLLLELLAFWSIAYARRR